MNDRKLMLSPVDYRHCNGLEMASFMKKKVIVLATVLSAIRIPKGISQGFLIGLMQSAGISGSFFSLISPEESLEGSKCLPSFSLSVHPQKEWGW